MPPPSLEVDLDCESIARLSGDERAMFGAGQAVMPALVWFNTRSSMGVWARCYPRLHLHGPKPGNVTTMTRILPPTGLTPVRKEGIIDVVPS